MKLSIIIPSFNQPAYIGDTLENAIEIKRVLNGSNIQVEILLFDSESNGQVQNVIAKFRDQLDYIEIKKDKGQFDAINKGMARATGDYWTWLNTDDTLDKEGMTKLAGVLKNDPSIDYIYGSIDYIDDRGHFMKSFKSYEISRSMLVKRVPGVFQQGSFFRKKFTSPLGLLESYACCFDYEFVLRCLDRGAKMHVCDFKVANFRQHAVSKTGSLTPVFIREQLAISKKYGRKPWHFLTWFSHLRLLKHTLFPR